MCSTWEEEHDSLKHHPYEFFHDNQGEKTSLIPTYDIAFTHTHTHLIRNRA